MSTLLFVLLLGFIGAVSAWQALAVMTVVSMLGSAVFAHSAGKQANGDAGLAALGVIVIAVCANAVTWIGYLVRWLLSVARWV